MKKLQVYGVLRQGKERRKEFLNTLYVDEQNKVVVDIERDDIRGALLKEINEKVQRYEGFLLMWGKTEKDEHGRLIRHLTLGKLQKTRRS